MKKLFRQGSLTIFLTAVTAVATVLLSSCDMSMVYYHYDHTPVYGWEKNDTLRYDVDPIERAGEYYTELGLRTNGSYPFTTLYLIVEQTVLPSHRVTTDTIACQLTNKDGRPNGQGVSYYQYTMPVGTQTLVPGDSLHITIRHNMKRDILPGISDVGLMIERE